MNLKEKPILVGIILFAILVTVIPYVYGFFTTPPGKEFLGLIGQNGHDQAFYLGWGAKQAENGHFLFEDKYNGYTSSRLVFNSLWLILGKTAAIFRLSVLKVFHLERILSSIFLLLVVYKIFSGFIESPSLRLYALLLISFSSGFGFFKIPLDQWGSGKGIFAIPKEAWTPDLWMIESNIFLTMLWEVVLPLATALFSLCIYWGYQAFFLKKRSAIAVGLLTLLLGSVYPYAVISVYCILGVAALFITPSPLVGEGWGEGKNGKSYLIIVLLSLPVVFWDGYIVLTHSKLTVGQALFPSPGLYQYFLGFGVLSILALIGIVLTIRDRKKEYYFLLLWVGVTFCQIYLPIRIVPFQMQLILGIQVPLVILSCFALSRGWDFLKENFGLQGRYLKSGAALFAVLLFLFSATTNLFHYKNVFAQMKKRGLPDYIDLEIKEAILWLAEYTKGEDLVLSSPKVAPYIPVLANNRMYSGDYPAPTADFAEKKKKIDWLFDPRLPKEEREISLFLKENRIDYIFYDPYLHAIGGEELKAQLMKLKFLSLVFENKAVSIFRVNPV